MNLYFVYILHYFETTNNQLRYNTKMYVQMKTATCQYRMYRQDATILTPYTNANIINRGSYMSAHVLLNLLNELGKRDKMRGLPSILSLFSQRVL